MLVILQAYLAEEDLRIQRRVKAKNIIYLSINKVQCICIECNKQQTTVRVLV